mgnify:FL=1
MKKFRGRRLLAMVMAVLMVIGMMPTDWAATVASAATSFTGGQEVTEGTWAGWTWSVFGEGTGNIGTDNKITDNGSSVTLYSGNNKGKISGNNDGGNYLYRKVAAGSDFIITADVKVDAWVAANQQAWGLITMSAVQDNGYTGKDKYNSAALVGGVQISGVQYQGHTRLNNTLTGANSNDISSNDDALAVASGEQGKTYKLTIQKTGSKVTLLRNNLIVKEIGADNLYTAGDMYVGLFTSRKVQATFSNINFDTVAGTTHSTTVTDIKYPTKALYIVGNTREDIDLTGFSAVVNIDGATKTISGADCIVKTADFSAEGSTNIVLDYYGTEIKIPITVEKEVVSSVEMKYAPVKNEYYLNEAIDYSGLDATVTYNSGRTFDLKALLDAENAGTALSGKTEISIQDPQTGLASDFTTAGSKKVYIKHTFGDVIKGVSYDVTVSGATVTELSVSGPNQTTFYKDVAVDVDAYKEGLLVTATFSDGSKKVLSDGFTVEAVGNALDVKTPGTYTYKVTYGGKDVTYELKVIGRTVKALEVTTLPTKTNYVKGESFSSDGIVVNAVYDSEEKTVVSNPTIDLSAFDGNTAGEYTIKVSATVDGQVLDTSFVVAVREKTAYTYGDLTWKSAIFGQSVNTSKMSVDTSEAGKVVIEAKEGAGKCTDDGQDGIAYYYTELDGTKDNFEITAKVTVDYFITKKAPDNQEGFGIMVRDAIGTNGDSSIFYSNAMSVGGYYGAFNVFGRQGVNSQDDTLGKKNITFMGKGKSDRVDAPKTFTLKLKKDNSGIYAKMTDESGNVVNGIDGNTCFYLDSDAFAKQTDTMYVGFMAARGAKIEVDTSSIQMNITSQSADAPQIFAPESPVEPKVSQGSLTTTADEDYTYIVNVNTKGLLSVKQNGKTLVSQKEVTAGSYEFNTTLIEGDNKFQVYFEPDATQNITSATPVIYNSTVTRKVYGPTKEPIYVSATGKSTAAGTKDDPLDIQTAIDYCQIGQAVYVLSGTYNLTKSTGVWKYNNGSGETGRKYLMKDPASSGDVVMDFGGSYADKKFVSNTFDFSGDYWTIDGIKFANGGGVRVGGNHNILKNCEFYGHSNSGLSISRTDGATNKADWPSYNQIISCNSYENRDKSDNNADGFAAKLTCGEGNVFRYCIAAYNADDGWDLFSKGGTGAIGAVEIYDSVCFANGYTLDGGELVATRGDGNGFKMGGSGIAVNHKVYNSYSFGNRANGFTNNSDPMGTYSNCIGYNNGGSNLELHVYTGVTPQFTVKGIKSYSDDTITQIPDLDYTDKEAKIDVISLYYSTSNYFRDKAGSEGKSVNSEGKELTASNFASLSEFVSIMKGGVSSIGRNTNGSINMGSFLKYIPTKDKPVKPVIPGGDDNNGDDDYDYDDDYSDFVEDTVNKGSVSVGTTAPNGGAVSSVTVDDSLKDLVGFTQVEINKITNGASASVTLDVKSTDSNVSDADKQAVADAIAKLKGSYKVGAYFDISVIKNVGGVSSQVSNLTAPVKITMTLDDSLINTDAAMHREYMVIRVHGDEVDALDATFDPATKQLSFYSDKFSTYAVVYKDTYASAPMTGDSANASMYVMVLMLAVLLMGCAGYGMKKRSKVNR